MSLRRFAWLSAVALFSVACSSSDPAAGTPSEEDAETDDTSTPDDGSVADASDGSPADTNDTGAADSSTADSAGDDASDASDAPVDTGPEACTKEGETETGDCGKCGKRARLCDSGYWLPWGACTGETGVCTPGETKSSSCGKCGTRTDTCSATCGWESGACSSEGVCNPGDKEVQYGACAVAAQVKIRTCGTACSWDAWSSCMAPKDWNDIATAPISGRYEHVAVWTGSKMIVWGGRSSSTTYAADGASYDPASDAWTTLPSSTIVGRYGHAAVWTGTEMLVWGGYSGSYRNDGASLDPSSGSGTWTTLPAPPSTFYGRRYHTAVWAPTTKEMIVWGGYGSCSGSYCADGAAYDPVAKSWRTIKAAPIPGRYWHEAVWAGTKMIVFGGYGTSCSGTYCGDAAAYDPSTDTWTVLTPPTPALDGRRELASVANDGKATFYGGYGSSVGGSFMRNTGATFDPSTGTWTALPVPTDTAFPDSRRYRMVAWWGAGKLWVWGGYNNSTYLATGASLDPTTSTWAQMPTTNAPTARYYATAVWTGSEAIVWGGYGSTYYNDGKIYRP